MSSSWTELSMFESHDIVRTKYKQLHGGEISTGKAAEITAYFAQAKQFFDASGSAGNLVSPLLMYYGVNALTRGTILFLNRSLRQASLKPSHGVTIVRWDEVLSGGITRIGELPIRIDTSGTFAEFTRTTSNRSYVPVSTDDFRRCLLEIPGTAEILSPTTVTFAQVLSRMPDIKDIHADATGEVSSVFNAGIRHSRGFRTDIDVYGTAVDPPNEQGIRSAVPTLADVRMTASVDRSDSRHVLSFSISHPSGAPSGELPPLRSVGGLTLLILPFPGGLDLSSSSILYLFAYAVGMLARYFPRQWLALEAGGQGDHLHPLIREGLRKLPRAFPLDIYAQLAPH